MFEEATRNPEFKNFLINLSNIVSRLSKVINYKEDAEIERHRLFRKLKEELPIMNIEKIDKIIQQLKQTYTDKIIRSIQVLIDVFNHHVPRIERYINVLQDCEYTRLAKNNVIIYKQALLKIQSDIYPLLQQQYLLLEEFEKNLGLRTYKKLVALYEKELQIYSEVWTGVEVHIKKYYLITKKLRTFFKKTKKVKDATRQWFHEFKENYPLAGLLLTVTFSFTLIYSSVLASALYAAKKPLVKIFSGGLKLVSRTSKYTDLLFDVNEALFG